MQSFPQPFEDEERDNSSDGTNSAEEDEEEGGAILNRIGPNVVVLEDLSIISSSSSSSSSSFSTSSNPYNDINVLEEQEDGRHRRGRGGGGNGRSDSGDLLTTVALSPPNLQTPGEEGRYHEEEQGSLFCVVLILIFAFLQSYAWSAFLAILTLFCIDSPLFFSDSGSVTAVHLFLAFTFLSAAFGGFLTDLKPGKYKTMVLALVLWAIGNLLICMFAVGYLDPEDNHTSSSA
jgi:hypothetical protein